MGFPEQRQVSRKDAKAQRKMNRWILNAAGLLLQTVIGVPLSFLSLIGTQGMHSDMRVGMVVYPLVALTIVHAIAAAVGLAPVAFGVGGDTYRAGIIGALGGAVFASLLFSAGMLGMEVYLFPPLLFLFPMVGSGIVMARWRKQEVPSQAD
jgi:hypothetical protein